MLKSKWTLSFIRALQSNPMLAAARQGRRKVDSIRASAGRPGIRMLMKGLMKKRGQKLLLCWKIEGNQVAHRKNRLTKLAAEDVEDVALDEVIQTDANFHRIRFI